VCSAGILALSGLVQLDERLTIFPSQIADSGMPSNKTHQPVTSPAPATLSPGASRERSGSDLHVGDRARMQDELAALKRLIIDRTQGNPFFMEEIVLALFDDGALVRNGEVKLTRSPAELKIPPTVQATLAARIDRLPAAEKELLQILAVIGQEIALELIKHVTGKSEVQLESLLSSLRLSELGRRSHKTSNLPGS
jgi:hypothetical protein